MFSFLIFSLLLLPPHPGTSPSPIILTNQNADHKVADVSEEAMIIPPSSTSSGKTCIRRLLVRIGILGGVIPTDLSWCFGFVAADYWLHVRLYYQGKLVTEVTTQTAEGCRISPLPSCEHEPMVGSPYPLQDIPFPPPQKLQGILSLEMQLNLKKLLLHLDKGVLLWVAPEGVYLKRQCQVRVYWTGPLAPNTDRPNKLEREKTCKLLDTERFMRGRWLES